MTTFAILAEFTHTALVVDALALAAAVLGSLYAASRH